MCLSVCMFAPCPYILARFMTNKLCIIHSSGLKLNRVPLSLVCTLLSLDWSTKIYPVIGPWRCVHPTATATFFFWGWNLPRRSFDCEVAYVDAWKPGRYAYLDSYCKSMPVFSRFFFPCAIAIVYIDYTESQRMAQIKATMWKFWEFLSVGSPVEALEDTLAVYLCFESNFKYVKLCSNSTLKWL